MTANAATQEFLNALCRKTGHTPQQSGAGFMTLCPAHEDRNPSLSVSAGDDRVLVKCFAGCSIESVVDAIGLSTSDLFDRPQAKHLACSDACDKPAATGQQVPAANTPSRIVATYDYHHEGTGELLYQVVRYDPKSFRQRRPDGNGGWIWNLKDVDRVLYRLGEVIRRDSSAETIFVVEGEKDTDRLFEIGAAATTCVGGAAKWRPEYTESIRAFTDARNIAVLCDNDDAGRTHGRKVAEALYRVAKSVKIVEFPGLPAKGDVSDWLDLGGTLTELQVLTDATPEWQPPSDSADDGTPDKWGPVLPLGSGSLPAFPVHVLPPVLRAWVDAESVATQTPADMAALLGLAVCASALARKLEVAPRRDWREPLNLFVAVLLESGNRKSAVFADATRPLKEYEQELVESSKMEIAKAACERRQAKERLKALEKKAATRDDSSRSVFLDGDDAGDEAVRLAQELETSTEPVTPALCVDDCTSEKLGLILSQQNGRLASMSPEGGVFDIMAGLYSKSGMPQFGTYLMGHSGDDLRTDRISRGPVYVKRPALTCGYAMQPAVVAGLADSAAFRGRGLLARFLYAAPESTVGQRDVNPPPVPEATRAAYESMVRTLLAIEIPELNDILVVPLTADAEASLYTWMQEIEKELDVGGSLELIRDWGSKNAGLTLRLAGVLHCVQHANRREWDKPITKETLEAAISIARYARPHADFVLEEMSAAEGKPCNRQAESIWKWMKREHQRTSRTEFSKRDIHRGLQRHFAGADELDEPLGVLVSHSYVREKSEKTDSSKPGRRASPVYEVNPAALAQIRVDLEPQDSLTEVTEVTSAHPKQSSVTSVNGSQDDERLPVSRTQAG